LWFWFRGRDGDKWVHIKRHCPQFYESASWVEFLETKTAYLLVVDEDWRFFVKGGDKTPVG
jgi:hypothetical protein